MMRVFFLICLLYHLSVPVKPVSEASSEKDKQLKLISYMTVDRPISEKIDEGKYIF